MSRKFSIISKIDLNRIDKEILAHTCMTGDLDPYLFMSEDTIKAIETEIGIANFAKPSSELNYKGVTAEYSGYKVFANNDLNFGIVEIR